MTAMMMPASPNDHRIAAKLADPGAMAWLGDTCYLTHDGPDACLYRLRGDASLQVLTVKGRPGFAGDEALGGVLYRVQWRDVDAPGAARSAGAASFRCPDGVRAAGNCIHLTCPEAGNGGLAQWWCYRPRAYDGGTLSLLHAWREPRPSARSRRLRALSRNVG
jgi:hypothetical protein